MTSHRSIQTCRNAFKAPSIPITYRLQEKPIFIRPTHKRICSPITILLPLIPFFLHGKIVCLQAILHPIRPSLPFWGEVQHKIVFRLRKKNRTSPNISLDALKNTKAYYPHPQLKLFWTAPPLGR
ncbi:hypothetical protein CEXT_448811 [Caerostris extrusa]|uniref:Uncharacterized protein n=1 Tax=Caerostris extrusa TaxID=172846 RepID=A0AAV4PJ84_CAEEX|nr:hypothetical protein CEXT_448811 [Caerostris extrusa]